MEVWEKFGTAMEWILRAVVAYLVIRAIEYGAKYPQSPKAPDFHKRGESEAKDFYSPHKFPADHHWKPAMVEPFGSTAGVPSTLLDRYRSRSRTVRLLSGVLNQGSLSSATLLFISWTRRGTDL